MTALLLGLLACAEPDDVVGPAAPEAALLVPLDGPRLARRTSLDLRGRLPSLEELDAVEADPAALGALRAEWMQGEPFEERFASLLAERWLTRVDEFLVTAEEYRGIREMDQGEHGLEYPFERAVANEPLRLMAHVAGSDAPWTDIVTADYTLANGLLAAIWPLEHPGGDDWAVSHYTDGRPAAGVLSTNGLWIRYYTTTANLNRRRAAVVADLLLCEDYLKRPVRFSSDTSIVDTEDALRTNPYCQGCHSSLDPMAVLLFGFYTAMQYNVDDVSVYHPEREAIGPVLLGVEGAFYGAPTSGLGGLGEAIAADPRFHRCTVETMASLYWRRPTGLEDFERLDALQASYEAGGYLMRPLLDALLADAIYQAGAPAEGAEPALVERERLARMMSPDVLATALGAWSGVAWTYQGYEQLGNDTFGYRVLAGGVDGMLVTQPQQSPGLTWELTVRRFAQAAAASAVEGGRVDATLRPGDAGFEPALVAIHRELLGSRPDAERLADLTSLWDEVEALSDGPGAWAAVIELVLRDPLFVTL